MEMKKKILVIGGGISGLTAAIEASEAGAEVILVERNPFLGGRVAQMHNYFPKLCPPSCGLEINLRRIRTNPRIRCLTLAQVESIAGGPGDYKVTVRQDPRFVNDLCTLCGDCVDACPVERSDEFNLGLGVTKAVYSKSEAVYPEKYVIDGETCEGTGCSKCLEVCSYNAIDLEMKAETFEFEVGAVIWATGWDFYDASKIEGLGFGKYPNVITNMMMERYASISGPTGGKIQRPSDDKEIESVAFVQCAGSRDENYLEQCSGVCCMGSLKQTRYVREQYPDAKIYVFYIDIRSPGRLEDFYAEVQEDENVVFVKGKVVKITDEPDGDLTLEAEDTLSGEKVKQKVNLAVLATGLDPALSAAEVEGGLNRDDFGFLTDDQPQPGQIGAGCARRPVDVAASVRDATSAALKAVQCCVE